MSSKKWDPIFWLDLAKGYHLFLTALLPKHMGNLWYTYKQANFTHNFEVSGQLQASAGLLQVPCWIEGCVGPRAGVLAMGKKTPNLSIFHQRLA